VAVVVAVCWCWGMLLAGAISVVQNVVAVGSMFLM